MASADGLATTTQDGEDDERTKNAHYAMATLGLPKPLVTRTLKKLSKVYGNDLWELLENGNYELLADQVFESQEKMARAHIVTSSASDVREEEGPSSNVQLDKKLGHLESSVQPPLLGENSVKHPGVPQTHGSLSLAAIGEAPPKQSGVSAGKVFRKLVASDVSCPEKQLGSSTTLKKEKPVKRQLESMVADLRARKEKLVKREHGPTVMQPHTQKEKLVKRQVETVVTELHATAEELQQKQWDQGNGQFLDISLDLSRGNEAYPIRVVNESNSKSLPPSFFYISQSEVHQDAHVNSSLTRIGDDHCCPSCKDNCLTADFPCACARETGGEFAYTHDGCLADRYLAKAGTSYRRHFCESGYHCPEERHKNEDNPSKCKGHPVRDFIKECWIKCGCSKFCGNRVVQRGISHHLEVFWTSEGKGWGIRTLEDLPAGAFVFEYVGEILTNNEMYERNLALQKKGNGVHTYPVLLDGDWGSEANLKDEEALCLDATYFGNVARFLNHRTTTLILKMWTTQSQHSLAFVQANFVEEGNHPENCNVGLKGMEPKGEKCYSKRKWQKAWEGQESNTIDQH
ncbi:hypothetical protein CY35_19G045800 [Sphagnum magellanicum]|nr:hypothetical protein CY35_19G045800 [Sphagnum magellanicum]